MRIFVRLACLILLVAILATPAQATRVRVNTLGGGEKRVTVPDEANVVLLPSLLVDVPDRVLVDVLEPSLPDLSFGAHFALSERDVLAVYGGARSRLVGSGLTLEWLPLAGLAAWDVGATAGILGDGDQPTNVEGARPAGGTLGELGAASGTSAKVGATGGLSGLTGTLAIPRADLQATALYAHRFPGWRLGVLVSAWADLAERSKPADEAYERRTTFVEARVGAGFDLGTESRIDLALVAGYATFVDTAWDADAAETLPRIEDDGLWQAGFVATSRLALFRGGAIVPYAEFLYRGEAVTRYVRDGERGEGRGGDFLGLRGTFGVDLALQPLPGVLVQPGIGFAAEFGCVEWEGDPETRLESTILVLPTYGVAVEAWVLDWLALRLSARQAVRVITDEWQGVAGAVGTRRQKRYDVETDVAMGLGFRFAGFTLDLLLNPDIFTTGPYGVTGEELDTLNLQAALMYGW